MNRIIWISQFVPFDKVAHAGGQIHNYYIKKLFSNHCYDLNLISFGDNNEIEAAKKDLSDFGIIYDIYAWDAENFFLDLYRRILRREGMINPKSKYAGATSNYYYFRIKNSKLMKENPDIIILQWTQMVLFLPVLKKAYPKCKFIAIEEDVMYLSYYRKIDAANSWVDKKMKSIQFKQLKKAELSALNLADLVILNNPKDERLINDEGIVKTWHWTPYFNNMIMNERDEYCSKDIIFYGAMSRRENHESVMWFINNIFNKIDDSEVRFVIVGNKPQKELIDLQSDRIIVTGFVDSVAPYFQNALCCVAPLVMGAGVKIKVIEALSAGVPVLTNDIGIEGIPAENGKEYLYCKSPDDYLKSIKELIENPDISKRISINAKRFIEKNYNFDRDAELFAKKLEEL